MRNQIQIFFGIMVIVVGAAVLLGAVLDIDVGAICFPTGLILLGVWLLLRPRFVGPETKLQMALFGPIRRSGSWQLVDEEMWLALGDVRLDLTGTEIPVGETHFKILGFIGNIRILVPEGTGVSVSSMSFITDARVESQRRNSFIAPLTLTTEDYQSAERRISIETAFFITDIRVKYATA